jgi:hypothetical protein
MQVTGGNPLALSELGATLTDAQLTGSAELGERLPPAEIVERAFLRRVGQLPAETRAGLMVVAADSGVTSTVVAACERLGLSAACLEPAEKALVIRSEGERIAFTHPLLRAAVYHAAPQGVRDRTPKAIADVLEPQDEAVAVGRPWGRRLWSAGHGSLPDDDRRVRRFGTRGRRVRSPQPCGRAAAAATLERAARLTPGGACGPRDSLNLQGLGFGGLAGHSGGIADDAMVLSGDSLAPGEIQHCEVASRWNEDASGKPHGCLRPGRLFADAFRDSRLHAHRRSVAASTSGAVGEAVRLFQAADGRAA